MIKTKIKSNSINHCFTNYFKSCNTDIKFKQYIDLDAENNASLLSLTDMDR